MQVDNHLTLTFLDPPFTLVATNNANLDRKITRYILMTSFFVIAGSYDLCHYFLDKPETNVHVISGFYDCPILKLSTRDLYLMTSVVSFASSILSMRKLHTLRKEFFVDACLISSVCCFILLQMTASGVFCQRQ